MRKGSLLLAAAMGFALMSAVGVWAATEKVLYSFTDGSDGGYPAGGVIFDSAGNLYGTTSSGGVYNLGTVFELSPLNGGWVETVLYNFTGHSDGSSPSGGLLIDKFGNLYGTTQTNVFELQRLKARWKEIVLYSPPGGQFVRVGCGQGGPSVWNDRLWRHLWER